MHLREKKGAVWAPLEIISRPLRAVWAHPGQGSRKSGWKNHSLALSAARDKMRGNPPAPFLIGSGGSIEGCAGRDCTDCRVEAKLI